MRSRALWCEISDEDDGVTLRFGGGESWEFSERLEDLKARIPPRYRRWNKDDKSWWVSYPYEGELQDWREEWFPPRRETQTETPPPRPRPSTARYADACKTLHLLPSAPPELVKAAYRTMATLHHPDHGGDVEIMKRINLAYEYLKD